MNRAKTTVLLIEKKNYKQTITAKKMKQQFIYIPLAIIMNDMNNV